MVEITPTPDRRFTIPEATSIGRYITDFCCHELKMIIELDGGYHEERKEYDRNRDAYLDGGGYTVLRFKNEEVLERMKSVIETIQAEARKLRSAF